MNKWLLLIVALPGYNIIPLQAQTLVTEMGPIMYFNSLDSTKSAILNRVARRCNCILRFIDSTHLVHLKLDLAISTDTIVYQLGYDNLYGNYFTLPDTAARTVAGMIYADAGLYIKVRDTVINETHILQLLTYGIGNYKGVKKRGEEGIPFDATFISQLFRQKPSPRIRRVLQYCR